jgi:uncharacterized protein with LGFP repeats
VKRRNSARVWSPWRPILSRPISIWAVPVLLLGSVVGAIAVSGPDVETMVAANTGPLADQPQPPPAVSDPIDAEYLELGGPAGRLGPVAGDELLLPNRAGTFRMYANGVIVWTADLGARAVDTGSLLTEAPDPATAAPDSRPDH